MRLPSPYYIFIFAFFLLSACGKENYSNFALTGVENLTSEQREVLEYAIEIINADVVEIGDFITTTPNNRSHQVQLKATDLGKGCDGLAYTGSDLIEIAPKLFKSVPQLTTVLAHEIGHIAGLEHNEDRMSIMHPKVVSIHAYRDTEAFQTYRRSLFDKFYE